MRPCPETRWSPPPSTTALLVGARARLTQKIGAPAIPWRSGLAYYGLRRGGPWHLREPRQENCVREAGTVGSLVRLGGLLLCLRRVLLPINIDEDDAGADGTKKGRGLPVPMKKPPRRHQSDRFSRTATGLPIAEACLCAASKVSARSAATAKAESHQTSGPRSHKRTKWETVIIEVFSRGPEWRRGERTPPDHHPGRH